MLNGKIIEKTALNGTIQSRLIGYAGTTDYPELDNLPSINDVELVGNKTSEDLGLASKDDIPVVPTKVSAFENDAGYLREVPSEYVTEEELNEKGYATTEYVDDKFNGANKAVSFINYSAMITSLNALPADSYSVGQNVMVVTLEVPDLWVSEIAETSVAYTYVSDDDFVSELSTNGSVQVGYYKLSALETQKVDLAEYVKNTDYATSSKGGVVKTSSYGGIEVGSNGVVYVSPASNANIDAKTAGVNKPIVPATLDYAVKVGLTTNTETLTDEEKAAAQSWLGVTSGVSQEDFDKLVNNETQIVPTGYNLLIGGASLKKTSSKYSVGVGQNVNVHSNSVAIGSVAKAQGSGDVSIGNGAYTTDYGTAVGLSAWATGTQGVAIGQGANAENTKTIQLGNGKNNTANTLQVFGDNIYNHNTHTLTVQNIELNGVNLETQLGDLNTALETILGV